MTSDEHGDYLAVDGRAVYTFTPDTNNTSTCFDDCALTWPPVTGSVVAGEGVAGTLGGFTRPAGGGRQVTYNGDPLYFFAADTAEGDTRGEGRGGVWFLAQP
ncbi:hypothetical protein BH24CHL7_BH24CHL7_16010 [soil metagenome]